MHPLAATTTSQSSATPIPTSSSTSSQQQQQPQPPPYSPPQLAPTTTLLTEESFPTASAPTVIMSTTNQTVHTSNVTTVVTTTNHAANARNLSALTMDEEFDNIAAAHSHSDSTATLKSVAAAACKRLHIGTAVLPGPLGQEPSYAQIVSREFNAIVIEHHLKWAPLCVSEPGPLLDGTACDRLGRYDFYHVDRIVDWAIEHGLRVKGHVLIWHVTSPTALLQPLHATALRAAMQQHINTVMGHYRGRIRDWDVVNEALAPDGSLAENLFFETLGPGYIADCFKWAHQADPNARLFYNDNKVEGIGTPKAESFYNLVADLLAEDVPLHGVGLQAHFKAGGVGPAAVPTPRAVKQQIHRLGALGLVVHLSELDVRVGTLEPEELRPVAQCQIYHDILAAALSEPSCEAIYLWGFTDKHTWIRDFYQDVEDADDEAPLLWDKHYVRKQSYFAVRQALASLTPGGRVGGEGVLLDSDFDVEGRMWGHTWRPDSISQSSPTAHATITMTPGDDRPDWLQDTNTPTNTATSSKNKPPPDALFKLSEAEAEVDIVEQNHRTMSSMELLHHDMRDSTDDLGENSTDDEGGVHHGHHTRRGGRRGAGGGGHSTDGESTDDDDEFIGRGASTDNISTDDDEEDDHHFPDDEVDQSGDDLTQPLENLRSDIPELS